MNIVITMSRRYGTGASEIAKELSEKLDIPVYDKAYIEHEVEHTSYKEESELIKKLAEKPCIILGRCASEILKHQSNVFNVYVSAAKSDRIKRLMEVYGHTEEEAKRMIEENDKARAEYYYEHTGMVWGDVNNYDLCLDTGRIGYDGAVDMICAYIAQRERFLAGK